MNEKVVDLRAIDRKRVNAVYERMQAIPTGNDIWYIHTVLAQCFLPYRDPKQTDGTERMGISAYRLLPVILKTAA